MQAMPLDLPRRGFIAGLRAATAQAPLIPVGAIAGQDEAPAYRSAIDLIRAFATRQIPAHELLDATINRIEVLDTKINAVVVREFDRARTAPDAAEAALGRGEHRPLLGLSMTMTEQFNVAGLPTTWGYPRFRDWRPDVDTESATYGGTMMEDTVAATAIRERNDRLALRLKADFRKYLGLGRANYYSALGIRWLASAVGLLAGLLGLTNNASAPTVGAIAGTGGLLLAFGRDLKFQQKGNWHYRRAEGALRFLNRLDFQLPLNPTAEDISSLAREYGQFGEDMTKQWEQGIALDFESAPQPHPPTEPKG